MAAIIAPAVQATPEVVVSPDEQLAAWVTPAGIQLRARFKHPTSPMISRNLAMRPNPTGTTGGWTTGSSTQYTVTRDNSMVRRPGTWSARADPVAGTNLTTVGFWGAVGMATSTGGIEVSAGQTYTYSIWSAATVAGARRQHRMQYYDSAGVQVGSAVLGPVDPSGSPGTAANTWTRTSWTFTPPAGAVTCRPLFVLYTNNGSNQSGSEHGWITDCQIEAGPTATDYFDGGMPAGPVPVGYQATGAAEYAWTGTANASPSARTITLWPNGWELRRIKILRDGLPVRSADPAWAVGGVGNAFDHEAPLDTDVSYQAIPVFTRAPSLPATAEFFDQPESQPGWAAGLASHPLTIRTPGLPDDKDCWLRSTNDPAAELALEVQGDPETSYQGRDTLTSIQGATLQAGGIDTLVLQPRSYVFKVYDQAELDALISLLTPAHVLLLQLRGSVGITDIYCVRGAVTVAWFRGSGWPERMVTVELKPVDRPSTLDSPLVIPGRSYADLHRAAPTYADVARIFPSYRDQLAIPEEVTL